MFGWDGVAHPTTFGRRLKSLEWRDNLALENIVTGLSQRVMKPGNRFVVIERHLPPAKRSPQLAMFDMLEGRYEVVVTNQRLKAENIWRLYPRSRRRAGDRGDQKRFCRHRHPHQCVLGQ